MINKIDLPIKGLSNEFKGWRVLQFSDVHYGFHYGAREFQKVVKTINELKPDIILLTGDMIHDHWSKIPDPTDLLRDINNPRGGKWAVLGNRDHHSKDEITKSLKHAQFTVLHNTSDYIESNGERLYIAGVDDIFHGNPDFKKALGNFTRDDRVLFLVHEPDLIDYSLEYNISAQFSGHSHGGQIQLPFLGPLFTPELSEKYQEGLYFVGPQDTPLYVNRGIGTTRIPVRLFCRPELTVFTLK